MSVKSEEGLPDITNTCLLYTDRESRQYIIVSYKREFVKTILMVKISRKRRESYDYTGSQRNL